MKYHLNMNKLLRNIKDEKYEKMMILSEEYQTNSPSNIYTSMINLYVAKIYHNEEKYTESSFLNFIIKNSSSKEMQMIANTRYTRILILQEKYNEAEKFITSAENFNDNALLIEMLGDISYVKSDIDKAKKYYESCLKT